jgi:hypothetical protein
VLRPAQHNPAEPPPEDAASTYTVVNSTMLEPTGEEGPLVSGYRVQLQVHPSREQALVVQQGLIAIYNISTLKRSYGWSPQATAKITSAVYTPDGRHIIASFQVRQRATALGAGLGWPGGEWGGGVSGSAVCVWRSLGCRGLLVGAVGAGGRLRSTSSSEHMPWPRPAAALCAVCSHVLWMDES